MTTKELLRYMDGAAPGDGYTRALENAVAEVRADENWRREYMALIELLRQHERLGRYVEKVSQVRLSRSRFNVEELASIYYIDLNAVKAILDAIDAHPDWDDEQIAESVDFE